MGLLALIAAGSAFAEPPASFPDANSPFYNLCEEDGNCGIKGASDGILYGSFGVGMGTSITFTVTDGIENGFQPWPLLGYVLAEGGNYGLTELVKRTVQRPRPYTWSDNYGYYSEHVRDDGARSFFSGHTSHTAANLFYAATELDLHLPKEKRGWAIGAYAFAATGTVTVGALRVKGGYHYWTDVGTGALVGTAFGVLLPRAIRWRPGKVEVEASIAPDGSIQIRGVW